MRTLLLIALTAALDAGPDAGARPDGGVFDAGAPDAGSAPRPKASWVFDGGWLGDGGVSDLVVLPVGQKVGQRFPHPTILIQCDQPSLVGISADVDTIYLEGLDAGHTQCGFWFFQQPFPNRIADVTVVR